MKTKFLFHVDKEDLDALRAESAHRDITVAHILRNLIKKHLKK
jgi:hypothetical protein